MQRYIKILFAASILLFTWSAQSAAGIWRDVTPAQPGARAVPEVRLFEADDPVLRAALTSTPHETSGRLDHHLQIPMPDGSLQLFSVQESPVMAASLAARYPDIRTFRVVGVDNQSLRGRIDITPLGFHAMIQTPQGRVFVDPDDFRLQNHLYRSRFASSEPRQAFQCGVAGHSRVDPLGAAAASARNVAARVPGNLLQYDLAVAATIEYHQFFGSIVGNTNAAIVITINRVNFIYERDLGIRLNLVADNDQLYETVESGQLSNDSADALLGQVNSWIDSRLPGGDTVYDIGHIFSRPCQTCFGGGVAFIGTVCDDDFKGGGVSGLRTPSGDAFDVDLVAHEIGHQFNAAHTFNGTTSSCGQGRVASSAYEPGSGSSIMAYSGICGGSPPIGEDLQSNSDAAFHAGSIAQIEAFTGGLTCQFVDPMPPAPAAGNLDPVLTALTDMTIPANTPFMLDASATDTDPLEYRWDQMDTGCATDAASLGTDNGSNPLFRSREPGAPSLRNFPALGTQVLSRYDRAEVLPCHSRALNFRVTATDGRSGQDFEDVRVTVDSAAGPFEVTGISASPIVAGQAFTVTWDKADTDLAPVNCANVDIELLAFAPGYTSYTVHSLSSGTSTLNDGSALVTLLPADRTHPLVRVRVKCSDNIFYDISDTDLAVNNLNIPPVALDHTAQTTQFYADFDTTSFNAPACGAIVECTPPEPESIGGRGGSSSFAWQWLVLLASLAGLRRCRRRQG